MSRIATQASRSLSKAAADLEQILQRDHEPAELRAIVDRVFDATAALMQAAGDIEAGLID